MRAYHWMLVAAMGIITACGEQGPPTSVAEEGDVRPIGTDPEARRAPMERLARQVALALADPEFRAYVRRSIDRSTYVERKLPFSRFLSAEGGRAGAAMARSADGGPDLLSADLAAVGGTEFYLPVRAHRTTWQGGEEILVATALNDHEAPVAFDIRGRRIVLDPDTPPRAPVLALVPQETDFDAPLRAEALPCDTCDGVSEPGDPGVPPQPGAVLPSLRMTYFSVNKDFEGWLKGDPEYEIHVMGPVSRADTLHYRTMYCIGEHGERYWNNNNDSWRGDVVLMSPEQLSAFHYAYPQNNFSIFAIEDDDTSCEIKVDQDRFSAMVDAGSRAYNDYKGARDSLGLNAKTVVAGKAAYDFLKAVANWFKTNDDAIGLAYANTITGYYHPDGNFAWIGEGANRFGFVKLELR
jgi:hypothetical protein